MDVNARNLISLDWDIYLNEWRLSFFEISSEFDFQQKFLNEHFALDLLLSGFWRQNVFWNFISKQVDLISGIMSLSRMYFNTVFRQFFLRFHLYFDSRPSSCEGGRLSCQRVTKYGPQCRHLAINGDTTARPSDPIVN